MAETPGSPSAARIEESALVERACAGDEEAFGRLVRLAGPAAIAAARRITRDAALAEDAAQEAFLRAYRSFSRVRAGTNYRAWLYKIATNIARTHVKQRSRIAARSPIRSAMVASSSPITVMASGRRSQASRSLPGAQ